MMQSGRFNSFVLKEADLNPNELVENFLANAKYLSMVHRMTTCSASDKSSKNFGESNSGRKRE
jgi:hypothetical protein